MTTPTVDEIFDLSLATRAGRALPGPESSAKGLGWFSLGLGLTELLAARRLARVLGVPGKTGLVRAFGLREIASGALIARNRKRNLGFALGAVAGAALLDIVTARALGKKAATAA